MGIADKLKALQIKADLIADDEVGLMEINTDVRGDVAVITGEVENEEQRQTAERIAYETDGIRQVNNQLRVVPMTRNWVQAGGTENAHLGYGLAEGSFSDTGFSLSGTEEAPGPGLPTSEQFPGQFTDTELEEDIHDRLAEQDEVDASRIEYSSINQIVRLSGIARNQDQLNRLLDVILSIRGVMGVDSDVVVEFGAVGTPMEQAQNET